MQNPALKREVPVLPGMPASTGFRRSGRWFFAHIPAFVGKAVFFRSPDPFLSCLPAGNAIFRQNLFVRKFVLVRQNACPFSPVPGTGFPLSTKKRKTTIPKALFSEWDRKGTGKEAGSCFLCFCFTGLYQNG